MKKNVIIIIGICLVLAILAIALFANNNRANNENKNSNITCEEIYNKIAEKVSMPEDMLSRNASELDMRYGIDVNMAEDYIYMANATSYYVDTIAIFKVSDKTNLNSIKSNLENIKIQAENSMNNYDADQYKIAKNGEIYTKGNFVILIMHENISQIKEIISQNI